MGKVRFEINAADTEYFVNDSDGLLVKDSKGKWCAKLDMVFRADELRQIADKLDALNKKG
jgi:hypothetical protein